MRSQITPKANIKFEWQREALRLVSINAEKKLALELLEQQIRTELSGNDTVKRLLTYLKNIWISPSEESTPLRNKAIDIYQGRDGHEAAQGLCYFMLIANYPFIKNITEICGRLIRLQEEVKMEQIKRKAADLYGESEHIIRSTRYAVAILMSIGILKNGSKKGLYAAGHIPSHSSISYNAFCLEAFLLSTDAKPSMRKQAIDSHLSLFAFDSHHIVETALQDLRFKVSRESVSDELIELNL